MDNSLQVHEPGIWQCCRAGRKFRTRHRTPSGTCSSLTRRARRLRPRFSAAASGKPTFYSERTLLGKKNTDQNTLILVRCEIGPRTSPAVLARFHLMYLPVAPYPATTTRLPASKALLDSSAKQTGATKALNFRGLRSSRIRASSKGMPFCSGTSTVSLGLKPEMAQKQACEWCTEQYQVRRHWLRT